VIAARDQFEFTEAPTDDVGASFIFPPTERNLAAAARTLRNGGLVAIPTETVYGLAADALNETACRNIFELKGRPLIDPLIVHLSELEHVHELSIWTEMAKALADAFIPGALTLILEKKPCVPDIVTAGKPSIAIRLPSHPIFRALSNKARAPLAAPSANPFSYVSPSTAEHVLRSFPNAGLPILQGGPCKIGIESTIVDVRDPRKPILLRHGDIQKHQLEKALGISVTDKTDFTPKDKNEALLAPGSLARHYSPKTPTYLLQTSAIHEAQIAGQARVYFEKPADSASAENIFWLSEDGDTQTAQRSLYSLLRSLDEDKKVLQILIELPTPTAANTALIDRLQRAASK
tara:strand:- start:6328 stop:7371 length:1044 start_codon:yes stop_codon:yes gene_type:complete